MAEAVHQKAVTRTEVVEVEPEKFVLTLTREEAEVLAIATWKVGGSPSGSSRKHFEAVDRALREAGVNGGDLIDAGKHGVDGHLNCA